MSEEKKQNIWIFLLSIIIVLLLIIIFLIVTDKTSLNKDNNEVNEEINNVVDNQNIVNNETNWGTYLLSMHLLEAKITRTRSIDLGDTQDFNQTITISKEDLTNILNDLQKKNLVKYYSLGTGVPTRDKLIISYEKNDNKYTLSIVNGNIFVEQLDEEFKNVLDMCYDEIEHEELKNQEGSHYFYVIKDYSENLYDNYYN